jgi:hypothetical protein
LTRAMLFEYRIHTAFAQRTQQKVSGVERIAH